MPGGNPYHDARGRFTSASGAGRGGKTPPSYGRGAKKGLATSMDPNDAEFKSIHGMTREQMKAHRETARSLDPSRMTKKQLYATAHYLAGKGNAMFDPGEAHAAPGSKLKKIQTEMWRRGR